MRLVMVEINGSLFMIFIKIIINNHKYIISYIHRKLNKNQFTLFYGFITNLLTVSSIISTFALFPSSYYRIYINKEISFLAISLEVIEVHI
jgi:hypothetical protein